MIFLVYLKETCLDSMQRVKTDSISMNSKDSMSIEELNKMKTKVEELIESNITLELIPRKNLVCSPEELT